MKNLISISILLIFWIQACEYNTNSWTTPCNDFHINYVQSSGWTGWKYDVTFSYPDSLIIYEQEVFPSPKERRSKYLISEIEMDSLFKDLQKLQCINLADNYGFGPNKPTDLPVLSFKYCNCNQKDSSLIYSPTENEMPVDLTILLGRLNRIITNHDTLKK
jgi:hypothetical protein